MSFSRKSVYYFLFMLCIFFITSCSENTPTSVMEPTVTYEPPELFPLAQGAKWEYSFSSSHSWSDYYDETSGSFAIWGSFSIEVTEENVADSERIFTLQAVYREDSLNTVDNGVSAIGYNTQDTTYISCRIALASDTLWYDDGGESEMLLPFELERNSPLLLRLFNTPGMTYFNQAILYLKEDRVSHDSQVWDGLKFYLSDGFNGYEYSTNVIPEMGIVFLEFSQHSTSANFPERGGVTFSLTAYTPGTPVEAP